MSNITPDELRKLADQYDRSDEFGYARQFGQTLRAAADQLEEMKSEIERRDALAEAQHELNKTLHRQVVEFEADRDRLAAENERLRAALVELRQNINLWRIPKAGGQDRYAGMPPGMRTIDETLSGKGKP